MPEKLRNFLRTGFDTAKLGGCILLIMGTFGGLVFGAIELFKPSEEQILKKVAEPMQIEVRVTTPQKGAEPGTLEARYHPLNNWWNTYRFTSSDASGRNLYYLWPESRHPLWGYVATDFPLQPTPEQIYTIHVLSWKAN